MPTNLSGKGSTQCVNYKVQLHRHRTAGITGQNVGSGSPEHSRCVCLHLGSLLRRLLVLLKFGTHFWALLKSGLGQSRYSCSFVWNMHFVGQSTFSWIYAIYLVFRRPDKFTEFFLLWVFALQKGRWERDKFNWTFHHVKALFKFVKGVYLISSSKKSTWAHWIKKYMISRSH